MTAYNRYNKPVTRYENELTQYIKEKKVKRQQVIKRAQELEKKAYLRKMQKLRAAVKSYEYDPA